MAKRLTKYLTEEDAQIVSNHMRSFKSLIKEMQIKTIEHPAEWQKLK